MTSLNEYGIGGSTGRKLRGHQSQKEIKVTRTISPDRTGKYTGRRMVHGNDMVQPVTKEELTKILEKYKVVAQENVILAKKKKSFAQL